MNWLNNLLEVDMNKLIKIFLIMIMMMSVITFGQNVNDVLRLSERGFTGSARALAMGNAYTAVSDDFSAALFNPAGFALIKKLEFDGGFNLNMFNNEVTLFGNKTLQKSNDTKLNQVGFIFPFPTKRGSFSLALGYNRNKNFNKVIEFSGFNSSNHSMIQELVADNDDMAYNLGLSYEVKNNLGYHDTTKINGNLNQQGKMLFGGTLNSWLIGSAIELEENIFFGGVLNIYSGTFNRSRNYMELDSKNYYPLTKLLDPTDSRTAGFESVSINDVIDWDISGYDLKLGLLAKLDNNFDVGFTIQFPSSFTIKETFNKTGKSVFESGFGWTDSPGESKYEYDISTPFEFSAGVAYYSGNLLLSGDATLVDYAKGEFTSGFDKSEIRIMNDEVKDVLQMVVNLNTGAEYYLPELGLALRAGFMYKPSAFKDDPSEYDKKFISGGIGYNLTKKLQLNVGYVYGWWKDIGDNYGYDESRTYQDISASNFLATIKYIF
jgi:long-subunit fatty acid transport protein